MVLAGFKPVASRREAAWVGSIPTRLRQYFPSNLFVRNPDHAGAMNEFQIISAVAVNLAAGVGSRSGKLLVERFGSAESALASGRDALLDVGLKADQVQALLDPALPDLALRQVERVVSFGGSVVALGTESYPPLLAATYDPPAVLYTKGDWQSALCEAPVVAIVGSRRASTYGRNVASRLARDLAARGITVLSGLARGIDATAHGSALEAGGVSVAVMGTGLDVIYPKEHDRLARRLVEHGALITEFPIPTPPSGQNFPYRNRVIAGLSLGVLVVEAAERSGSLITARLANELGRDVYAVPGNVTSANSFGPNYLIKDGAKLVQTWRDVVEELPEGWRERILIEERERAGTAQATLGSAANISANEGKILKYLRLDAPTHADSVSMATQLDPGSLADALFTLEAKGLVAALPGGFYLKRL